MPRLSDIGDSEALDNRYARKVVVYVEAETDAAIYYALSGVGIREYLEFKVPTSLETGGDAVRDEVVQRRSEYARTFGIVDGEEAAKYGAVDALLRCRTTLFRTTAAPDGVIFLGHHEAENVLLLHGDLPDLVRRERDILDSADLTDTEIAQRIATVTRHFFQAALLKYASMTENHRANQITPNTGCRVIDSARFLANSPRREILASIEASVMAEGVVAWGTLTAEAERTWTIVRTDFVRSRPDAARCAAERMRLADGKSVVKRLAGMSRSDAGRWSNHLLENAKVSGFAQAFRRELLEITQAAA